MENLGGRPRASKVREERPRRGTTEPVGAHPGLSAPNPAVRSLSPSPSRQPPSTAWLHSGTWTQVIQIL